MNPQNEILITGSRGQLGSELKRLLGDSATYVDREELDLTDAKAVTDFLRANNFKYIVNCAAYTAVDRAEEDKMACAAANIDAVKNLASLSEELGYRLLHISTDYVFNGDTCTPYTESDRPEPMSVYGSTKRKGETALIGLDPSSMIIRTGWLYSEFGHNFVKTILTKLREGAALRVVDDQYGTPTCAADLAAFIAGHVLRGHWNAGLYHYAAEGVASWYDFAVAIAAEAGIEGANISPVHTADYPTPAARPHFSVLDKSKIKATFGITLPYWRDSLRRCLRNIETNG